MEFNVHPIPVFCALDVCRKMANLTLGDLNFVTKKAENFLLQLGYTGPGWQHRVLTEWLLHAGVICWGNISHTLTATAHHPADILTQPLRAMEAAWEGAAHGKRSINSVVGLWCIDETFAYKHTSSKDDRDAPPGALKSVFHYEGGCTNDYVTTTRLSGSTSLHPLHDLCMCTEAARVGQMIYCLKRERATIYEFKTNSVLYRP